MQRFSLRISLLIVVTLAHWLLIGCSSVEAPAGKTVMVRQVSSGQMIEVLDPSSATPLAIKVRLIGIDAPAWKQEPWFTLAHNALADLLESNQPVQLEFDAQPNVVTKAGNTLQLAYVWKDGVMLNEALLKQGWGLARSRSPNLRYEHRLTQAQERARLLGLGIWNPEDPMRETPEEFRKRTKSAS